MLIRYGCELSVVVERPTPVFCLVDIHPDRRKDIIREMPFPGVAGIAAEHNTRCLR